MPSPSTALWRTLAAIVLALGALLGVGLLTFLVGGVFETDEPAPRVPQLDVEHLPDELRSGPEAVLSLPWEDESEPGVARSAEGDPPRFEAVFSQGELLFVVDHPGALDGEGTRVRWYSGSDLVGEHIAPITSTLFTPRESGFMYVLAKSGGPSERVVTVDSSGAVVATYTIPLNINSGGLLEAGGFLYASALSSEVDLDRERQEYVSILVPVAKGGRQLSDAEARDGSLRVWTIDSSGTRYEQSLSVQGLSGQLAEEHTVTRTSDGEVLIVPPRAEGMGITEEGLLVLLVPPRPVTRANVGVAGWRGASDDEQEVLVATFGGMVRERFVIPFSLELSASRGRVWFGQDALLVARSDEQGIHVVRFRMGVAR